MTEKDKIALTFLVGVGLLVKFASAITTKKSLCDDQLDDEIYQDADVVSSSLLENSSDEEIEMEWI